MIEDGSQRTHKFLKRCSLLSLSQIFLDYLVYVFLVSGVFWGLLLKRFSFWNLNKTTLTVSLLAVVQSWFTVLLFLLLTCLSASLTEPSTFQKIKTGPPISASVIMAFLDCNLLTLSALLFSGLTILIV